MYTSYQNPVLAYPICMHEGAFLSVGCGGQVPAVRSSLPHCLAHLLSSGCAVHILAGAHHSSKGRSQLCRLCIFLVVLCMGGYYHSSCWCCSATQAHWQSDGTMWLFAAHLAHFNRRCPPIPTDWHWFAVYWDSWDSLTLHVTLQRCVDEHDYYCTQLVCMMSSFGTSTLFCGEHHHHGGAAAEMAAQCARWALPTHRGDPCSLPQPAWECLEVQCYVTYYVAAGLLQLLISAAHTPCFCIQAAMFTSVQNCCVHLYPLLPVCVERFLLLGKKSRYTSACMFTCMGMFDMHPLMV